MFEVFIPLVLFFILVAIRSKQPAKPMGAKNFHALPLPSSGVIAIMQAFCDGGHVGDEGFVEFPNARYGIGLESAGCKINIVPCETSSAKLKVPSPHTLFKFGAVIMLLFSGKGVIFSYVLM
jgi:hypothetical protein